MKIILSQEDEAFLQTIDQNFKDLLSEKDPQNIHRWFKKESNKTINQSNIKTIFSKLLNNLDELFETALTHYRAHITSTEVALSTVRQDVDKLEQEILWILKAYIELLKLPRTLEVFNSFERVIELLPLANNFKLLKKAIDVIGMNDFRSGSAKDNNQTKNYPRMVHNLSMIILHRNLYNQKPLSLIELLSDDAKFKEFNIRKEGKLREIKYDDSLEFEYFVPNLQSGLSKEKANPLLQEGIEGTSDNDNITIEVKSLKEKYPGESHYAICKKLLAEKRLNIEEGSPIFDALLFRIRIAQDFEQYQKRVLIVETVLSAIITLDTVRKVLKPLSLYEPYIYQSENLLHLLNEVSELFYLQVTPSTHKKTLGMFFCVLANDRNFDYNSFYTSKFDHTGEFNFALKDLTSLELKVTKGEGETESQKVSLDSRSLILPNESVSKPELLDKMILLILSYIDQKRKRNTIQDFDSLSHLIPSILNILTLPTNLPEYFLYPKSIFLATLSIIRRLSFYKEFAREFKIIETLIDFGDSLFQMLISAKKGYWRQGNEWQVAPEADIIELLSQSIRSVTHYLIPTGRYASRAEMATTITRKFAESGIMKSSIVYLSKNTEFNPSLFLEILKVTSEICRESQGLVPRLIESGIVEEIFRNIRENFAKCDYIGDMLGFISNVCLQEIGKNIERKYKVLELFFEAFTEEKFNELNKNWYKQESKIDKNKLSQLEKTKRELIYLTEYVPGYYPIVTAGLLQLANSLLTQAEGRLGEIGTGGLNKKTEEEQKQFMETKKNEFENYLYKLVNFTEIYGRYVREPRIRRKLSKEGCFELFTQLLSISQVLSIEYNLPAGRAYDYFFEVMGKEFENPDSRLAPPMEKLIVEELNKLEKVIGPFNKLNDLSEFVNEEVIRALDEKGILHASFAAKEKAGSLFLLIKGLSTISFVLEVFVTYKLGSIDFSERLFHLYSAYLKTSLKHKFASITRVLKEEEKSEDTDEKKPKNTVVQIWKKDDILGRRYTFQAKIKAYLDQCFNYELVQPTKNSSPRYANLIKDILQNLSEFKEVPADIKEKTTWVLRTHLIFKTVHQLLSSNHLPQVLLKSALPGFAFELYDQGVYEVLAEKMYLIFKYYLEDDWMKNNTENKVEQERFTLLKNSLKGCLEESNHLYEKVFFPKVDITTSAVYKEKSVPVAELHEYVNSLMLSHTKIVGPFFELMTNVHKKLKEIEKEETKETEAEKKEEKKDVSEILGTSVFYINQFAAYLFATFARALEKRKGPAGAAAIGALAGSKPKTSEDANKAAVEKVIDDLVSMGYHRDVAVVATRRIQYLNTSLALDWIFSNPDMVEKIEKKAQANTEKNAPADKKSDEKVEEPSLGVTKLEKTTTEEFVKIILVSLQELSDKLLSNLFLLSGSENGIYRLFKRAIEFHEENNKKGYSQHLAIIILKLFKTTVNHYFKNSKFISSFKIPKNFDKNLGKDVVKQNSITKASPIDKLQYLEGCLYWFGKFKSFVPNFEKNFLRSEFLSELMSFYDALLSHTDEIVPSVQPATEETKETMQCLQRINQSMLKIFSRFYSLKQNLEPESSEKKTDKSTLSEDTDKKNLGRSFKPKKSPIEILITLMNVSTTLYNKSGLLLFIESDATHNLLEMLSMIIENPEQKRQFFRLNGLSELLKFKAEVPKDAQFLNDLVVFIFNLLEEPSLVLATLETKVKTFFQQRLLQNNDIPIIEFFNSFKGLSIRHHKLLVEVMQKICTVYAKERDAYAEKKGKSLFTRDEDEGEKSKARSPERKVEKATRENPAGVVNKRFIKLKENVDFTKLECTRRTEKKRQKSVEEVDLSEPQHALVYKPSENISQILNTLIENIVGSFNQRISKLAENQDDENEKEKKTVVVSKEIFPYHALLKVLTLIGTEHPLLLPTILNHNCSGLLESLDDEKLPLFKKAKAKSNVDFLSYYLRVISTISLDKLQYFLLAISSSRDTQIVNAEGETVFMSEEVTKGIINEIKEILQSELARPDYLETAESIQNLCAIGSLLINLLQVRQTLKIIIEKDAVNKKGPSLLELYIDAVKKLKRKNYYKLENVLPFVLEPCSILIQYNNYLTIYQGSFSVNEKYVPTGILAKHTFGISWDTIQSLTEEEEQLQLLDQERGRLRQRGDVNIQWMEGGEGLRHEMPDNIFRLQRENQGGDEFQERIFHFLNNREGPAGERLLNLLGGQNNLRINFEGDGEDEDDENVNDVEWNEVVDDEDEGDENGDDEDENDDDDDEVGDDENESESDHENGEEGHGNVLEAAYDLGQGLLELRQEESPAHERVGRHEDEDDEEELKDDANLKTQPEKKEIQRKKQLFTDRIKDLLKEGLLHNEDLANVFLMFSKLFWKIEDPTALQLTVNNPSQYELLQTDKKIKNKASAYLRIYGQLETELSNNPVNEPPSKYQAFDRLINNLVLQRGGPEESLEQLQNIFEGNYLQRAQPAQAAQPRFDAEDLSNFVVHVLDNVDQEIPPPEPRARSNSTDAREPSSETGSRAQPATASRAQFSNRISDIFSSVMQSLGQNRPAESQANAPAEEAQQNATENTQSVNAQGEVQSASPQLVQESGSQANLGLSSPVASPRLQPVEVNAPVNNNEGMNQPAEPQSPVAVQQEEQKENNEEEENAGLGQSNFRFADYGIDENFLQNCGIDMSIFEILPEEEQVELVLGLIEQNSFPLRSNTQSTASTTQASTTASTNTQAQIPQGDSQASQPQAEESKEENASVSQPATTANNLGSPLQPLNPDSGEQSEVQPEAAATGQAGTAANTQNTAAAQNNPFGIDPEILANLDSFPEDLRNDILRQNESLQNQFMEPAAGPAGDMDIATFIETLDPSLRQEIFMSSDQNFIDALPSHLAAEAEIVRNNGLNRYSAEDAPPQRFENIELPLNFIEKALKKEKKDHILQQEKREKLFESDERLIESILRLIYLDKTKFRKFPFELLATLAQHPRNEFIIFDTLMFLLKNKSLKEETQEETEENEPFPPRTIIEKNRIIKDKMIIYEESSPHILFILQCLTRTRSDYFVKDRDVNESFENPPTLQRNTSLDSIKHLRQEMQIKESHPLYDLLQLCSSEAIVKNPANVSLITNIIENICKNPNIFYTIIDDQEAAEEPKDKEQKEKKEGEKEEEKKEEEKKEAEPKKKTKAAEKEEKEEIYLCKYKLDEQSVWSFCQLLYSENLSNLVISKLSFIIGVFCQEKHNLNLFIKVMKEILYKVSLESNKFLQERLVILKSLHGETKNEQTQNQMKSLLNEIVAKFKNQLLIRRIAKIIMFLYENTVKYLKAKQKYEQIQNSKKKDKKEEVKPQRKGSLKDELFVKAKEEIIKSLETIMLDENLKAFWINVSECVHLINEKLSKNWDVQNLLNANVRPIIESFFIIHKILNDEEYAEYTKSLAKPKKEELAPVLSNEEEIDFSEFDKAPTLGRGFSEMREIKMDPNEMFTFICEKNKKVINNMIKQDLSLLNDSMSLIAKKVPKILDFEIRRGYFWKELAMMQRPGAIRLRIKRDRLMENSFNQLYSRNGDDLRRKLQIEFVGEEGMDAGGVAREWFLELSKQVFNANYNLFVPSANGNTFQPSLLSDNLDYFRFIGKFIAKALFDRQLLECYFTRSFYKHILGQPINYHDIEDVDPDYYKNLKWILENDITNVGLDLTFSYEFDKFGQLMTEELIPNGQNIPVTEENKSQYVHLICNHKMARGIKAQIEKFLIGFFELIPKNLISIFDSKELELLISGLPDIDIVDLKENTEYHGYSANSQVIKWFWEILEEFDHTQKANLLQFVTGTSKVPLEGFKALKGISGPQRFQIHRAGNPNSLPTGHTCFNQLDIPEYGSKEQLIEKLLLAITEGKEGFGFA